MCPKAFKNYVLLSTPAKEGAENCKLFCQGPFKQYMGRSMNTGNLTIVLYEDPPDGVPKIHIRSRKYMAWIAENQLPTHMHVSKV